MLNAYEYADLVNDARNNTYTDKMESINRKRMAQNQQPLVFSISDTNATRLQNTGNDYNTIVPVEILPYLRGEKGWLIQIGKMRFSVRQVCKIIRYPYPEAVKRLNIMPRWIIYHKKESL